MFSITWGPHLNKLLTKAKSRLGLLKRTCHFSKDKRQKRSFYLAMVRSIFEHCSQVWSPQYATHIEKCEALQKSAIKWINGDSFVSYSTEKYNKELKSLNILPMKLKFIYNDLVLFYKIANKLVPIVFPSYISVVQPESIRFTRSSAAVHNQTDISLSQCTAAVQLPHLMLLGIATFIALSNFGLNYTIPLGNVKACQHTKLL